MKVYFILIFLIFFSCSVQGEEIGYVSDSFWITLRTGPGINYKIITFLKSGEPLKIISKEGNWTKVKLLKDKSKEGWVLSRFIMKRKPCKSLINELVKKNTQLKETVSQLQIQLANITKENEELSKKLEKISNDYQDLKERYETLKKDSSDFLSLKERYEDTAKKLKKAESKIKKLEKENDLLKRSQAHRWFLMGAFVLFSGIILGLIMGRQKKRRSIYYS